MAGQDVIAQGCLIARCVCQAQSGSDDAFAELVNRFQPHIQRFLLSRSHNIELSKDLSQDTFLSAYEHLSELNDPQAFEAWLYQIARHCWYMYLRHRGSSTEVSLATIVEWIRPPNRLVSRQSEIQQMGERLLVQHVLNTMRPKLRKALWLRHVVGLSDREIAGAMHISPAAAQKRAHRAEAAFRVQYDRLTHSIGSSIGS